MIITGLLNLLYYFILAVSSPIRLLPNATLPASMTEAITTAGPYLKGLDFVISVSSLIVVLILLIGIEAGILIYKLIMWVLRKIPGIN